MGDHTFGPGAPGLKYAGREVDTQIGHTRVRRPTEDRGAGYDVETQMQEPGIPQRHAADSEMPAALEAGQLFCVYQPAIDLAANRVHAFETLVRWQHPEHGILSPSRIIPAAQATGSESSLFATVLDQALATQARWHETTGYRPAVTLNVSAGQLTSDDALDRVARALTDHEVPAESVWLEVTESALADDKTVSSLLALHDLGLRLAVDNVGSGWSSLGVLASCPWELFKIDRPLVATLGEEQGAEQRFTALMAIASALGARTLAEGVETADQLERVRELGCEFAQGFFLGRPVGAEDATRIFDTDGSWLAG